MTGPYQKRTFEHREIEREDLVKTQGKNGHI